MFNQSLEYNDK